MSTDLVIILSSDWVGSTATRTQLGEERADALQEVHDALLRKVIAAEGGRVVKHYGDGVLATFHSVTAALTAAVDIQQHFRAYSASPDTVVPMPIRVGLAAGDVKNLSGDIFGTPVVEAVRLQSAAAPGEILCSELVRVLGYGRGDFDFDDAGMLELKGLPGPVHAQRVRRSARGAAGEKLSAPPPPRVPASEPADASIAVLPFVNMSSDREQDYFSDGLSEELINQLAQIKALRVAGRTSSFALRGKADDFKAIGARLGVNHVLEGSVRKAGKRLRITAQLIKCSDGFHLFSERYDREFDDVFAIQDEIARAVCEALRVTLGIRATRVPGGTSNVEAWDLMLRARSMVRGRDPGAAGRAVELLQRATALDPTFALAWNVLGNALTSLLTLYADNRDELRREIDRALGRSVELAPDLWTGHEARANQLELRHDWVGAEQANAKARTLAPGSMREPIKSRAHQLALVGRVHEAIPFAREALRIEPLVPLHMLQLMLDIAGRHAEAEAEYASSRDLTTNRFLPDLFGALGMVAVRDHATARERLALCAAANTDPRSFYPAMLEGFDDRERALSVLRQNLEGAPERGLDDFRISQAAFFASCFGAPELALAMWRRISPITLGINVIGLWHPVHVELRALPGFKDLVRELGLLTYWRTTGQWGEFARPLGTDDFACW